jgi:hypothetical protein
MKLADVAARIPTAVISLGGAAAARAQETAKRLLRGSQGAEKLAGL